MNLRHIRCVPPAAWKARHTKEKRATTTREEDQEVQQNDHIEPFFNKISKIEVPKNLDFGSIFDPTQGKLQYNYTEAEISKWSYLD